MKEQKKSSWGAVLVSFLKEFLLNSFEAPGHLYYVSAKYCYITHELRLHQNDRCKRFTPV